VTKRATIGLNAYGMRPEDTLGLARAADEFGFDTFWSGEHYVIPRIFESEHPTVEGVSHDETEIVGSDVRIYDPWFLLGAVAGATKSIKIGTAICIAPMLHPLLLARASVTAHELSNGRFMMGVGAGWMREEFDAYQIPYAERGARLDDSIEVLLKAWAGGQFSHSSAYWNFESVQISPHPVQIPLVCGGNTGPALRRVGKIADAWMNSSVLTLDQAQRLRETIEAERRIQGTTERRFTYYVRPTAPDPREIERFIGEGFENLVLWGPDLWSVDARQTIEEKREKLALLARDLGLIE
jgi:probable F420-dependent oxidoreductase